MKSNFGPPTNQVKLKFSESLELELSEYTIFIDFRQVCKKLWGYKRNLTTFWHGLFPNMDISRDPGKEFVIFIFKIVFCLKF